MIELIQKDGNKRFVTLDRALQLYERKKENYASKYVASLFEMDIDIEICNVEETKVYFNYILNSGNLLFQLAKQKIVELLSDSKKTEWKLTIENQEEKGVMHITKGEWQDVDCTATVKVSAEFDLETTNILVTMQGLSFEEL